MKDGLSIGSSLIARLTPPEGKWKIFHAINTKGMPFSETVPGERFYGRPLWLHDKFTVDLPTLRRIITLEDKIAADLGLIKAELDKARRLALSFERHPGGGSRLLRSRARCRVQRTQVPDLEARLT